MTESVVLYHGDTHVRKIVYSCTRLQSHHEFLIDLVVIESENVLLCACDVLNYLLKYGLFHVRVGN